MTPLGALSHPIRKEDAARMNHAIHAPDAEARAIIFLRLLAGETHWGDGYERKVDDCFEMNDGDRVCGYLVEWADYYPDVARLLTTHRTMQTGILAQWRTKYRDAHTNGQLAFAI